jgi:hypothetical protein
VGGAVLILALMGCAMLAPRFHSYPQTASAQAPISLLATTLNRTAAKAKPDAKSLLSQLPLIFEPNQGQADSGVKFVSRGAGYGLYLDETGAVLALPAAEKKLETVRMTLVGANRAAVVVGSEPLPGTSNYFIGNDPKRWHTGIPQFAGVRYESVYPGIDLVFYGSQGHLEYDFKVAPGADPAQAELQFDGARKLKLSGGDLILTASGSDVRLHAPQVYQRAGDTRQTVDGRFVLRAGNRVGFEVGPYDHSRELVIDPTISYATYFGGSGSESCTVVGSFGGLNCPSIAVNGNGLIYLAGNTTSTDLPVTTNATQATLNGTQNIFVLALDPTAGINGVKYLTYLGGSGTDSVAGIAVDGGGNAYVAGTTTSPNFPTANGYQSVPEAGSSGTSHVFVSEINQITSAAAPTLNYSTYLSGNGTDIASGMTVDQNRVVFVTGTTTSTDVPSVSDVFPASYLPKAYQQSPSPGSTIQFFVTEVNTKIPGVNSIAYSTYFGGGTPSGAIAVGGGIAVDTVDNVYFSGTTNFYNSGEGTNGVGGLLSTDFPILNAYQPCLDTPPPTQISTQGVTCVPPTTTPYPTDAFVAKLYPANAQTGATQLLFSTYFGGGQTDSSTGLTIDTGAAAIYITGTTNTATNATSGFVIPNGTVPYQDCLNTPVNPAGGVSGCPAGSATSPTDAYVAKFTNPAEAAGGTTTQVGLSYFSYLGGTGNDSGLAIAVDTAAGALLTGATSSSDFPVIPNPGAIQTHLNGTENAFFAHLNTTTTTGASTVGSYVTYFGGNGVDRGTSIAVDPALNSYIAGDTTSSVLQTSGGLQTALNGPSDAFALKLQTEADLCFCVAPVLSPASTDVSAGNPITITFSVTNQGPDLATNITVTGQLSTTTSATFNSGSAASGTCSTPSGLNLVCNIPTLQAGSTSTVTFSVTPKSAGAGSLTATVTSANQINTSNSQTATFTATDYALGITPSSQTVVAGNAAQYFVQVSPSQTFGANVSLTCSSPPVGASCNFSPTSLVFTGTGPLTSTLTLTTTERPVVTISSTGKRGPIFAFWLMIPGMALLGIGSNKRSRSRVAAGVGLAVLFAFFALQPACSKSKQQPTATGTPAGSYNLTVTGTSGSFSQSAGFSLTVQ